MATIQEPIKIIGINPHTNLPYPYINKLSGPYYSRAEALVAVPLDYRALGLVLGIVTGGSIVEYWFKSGLTDNDLIVKDQADGKIEDLRTNLELSISNEATARFEADEEVKALIEAEAIVRQEEDDKTNARVDQMSSLGVKTVFSTYNLMISTPSPVDDKTGDALVFGQLVAVTNDIDSTKNGIYRYNAPGYVFIKGLGDLDVYASKVEMLAYQTEVNAILQSFQSNLSVATDYVDEAKPKTDKILLDGDGKMYLANDGEYKRVSGGGGYYNVTVKHPLPVGEYYTKTTAIAAIQADDITPEEKSALIITFEDSIGSWTEYRFVGTTFNDPEDWIKSGDKDSVKAIYVNNQLQAKSESGEVRLEVLTEVDKTIDSLSDNAVANSAVAAEFNRLSAKYGTSLKLNESGDDDDKKFSISLLDEEDNVLSTTDEFSGGGGGGGGTSSRVVLTKITDNLVIKEGDEAKLIYYYDHRDTTSGTSTGLPAKATTTIIAGATSTENVENIAADKQYTVDVTKYLLLGNNTVRVKVEVDNGETVQVSTISWRIQVVSLKLNSSYDYSKTVARGTMFTVPFSLSGSGSKSLRMYIDGVLMEERTIASATSNGAFSINSSDLHHGSHSIQMVAELTISDSSTIKSNSIYFDVAVVDAGLTPAIVATRFDFNDGTIIGAGNRPYITARQFEEFVINYAGYNPNLGQDNIVIKINGETISSIVTSFVQRSVTNKQTNIGNMAGQIIISNTIYTFNVIVSSADVNIVEPTDNLELKLSALGRSNNDDNRNEWKYGNVTTEFQNVLYVADGWINNALRLSNNGKAIIKYQPLSYVAGNIQNSFAFTCKFKATNVSNVDGALISCVDSDGVGFVITSEEVRMTTRGNSQVLMKIASGQAYNIGFVSFPIAQPASSDDEKLNTQMLFLYIDGIAAGGVQRGTTDSIYQLTPQYITLDGQSAVLDVYTIRAYSGYLSADQMLDIFMLDLDSAEEILNKYNSNNVVDEQGIVTVESVPDDVRYIIITGQQENGMSTVHYAAAMNNKNTRYDVDEILHIKRSQPSLNFKLVGGCIRLQGTSSLAYPIKNYRIYFKNAAKVNGVLTTGCDEQGNGGELQTKIKFSFKLANSLGKVPAPVNVWCLKADYAESSSSHNTGMAILTNETLVRAGDPTPAQKHVNANYMYDVRTTVDGEPCYLFYRKTILDTPTFVGKYNMNNDKSTEDVFGFLDIPGYHDAAWVNDKFGGVNPTECWEFLNNDYPMGMYLDDDFVAKDADDKPHWLKVFEARFPDDDDINDQYEAGTKRPYYLERFVSWVKSTNGNGTKFRNELSNYMDVRHLCDYYMFTDLFGAVDQRVKNAMLGFWYSPDVDKMLGYYIFYDNDTILGVRNDGRLKYYWDINHTTIDPELTAAAGKTIYAYAGHDSVLWENLRNEFATELQEAYIRLRAQMTNDYIFNVFGKNQSERFAERIYNIDAKYKYISPKTLGVEVINSGVITNVKYSYLEAMQGNRSAHRRWWLSNRLDLFDARYGTGLYNQTDIAWKGISDVGAKISLIAARDYYFEFKREGATMAKSFVEEGDSWSYTYNAVANVGTIFHLYGGKYIFQLDLSEWGGFVDMNIYSLPNLVNLILGRSSKTYTLSELAVGTKFPMLKKIDVTNYISLPTLDLTGCTSIEEVIAVGCSSMASIQLPKSAPVRKLVLPNALKTLNLEGFPYLSNADIQFPGGNAIENLIVDSSPNIDWELLYDTLGVVKNLRITGINKTGTIAWLNKFITKGGIDESGTVVDTCSLIGTFQLTKYIDDDIFPGIQAHFPELLIKQPEYTVIEMDDAVSDEKNVSNLDNETGYKFGTPYVPNAHIAAILKKRYGCLAKQVVANDMRIIKLHDDNFNYYADGTTIGQSTQANIIGDDGDCMMYEPHFWYKGVNDHLNNKKYFCYSSNATKPSATNVKALTLAQIQALGGHTLGVKVLVGQSSLVTQSDSLYGVCKVDITGYDKVAVPMVNNRLLACANFTNDSNVVLQDVVVAESAEFFDDMYVIVNAPAGATKLNFTYNVTYGFDKVVLGHTTNNITDFETDWIEHDHCLCAIFQSTIYNSKLMSVVSTTQSVMANKDTLDIYTANRNMQLRDWEMFKDNTNLFFMKYGRRDSQLQCGRGAHGATRIIGDTAVTGMTDTIGSTINNNENAWYYNTAGVLTKVNNTKCMGYENIYGCKYEALGNCSASDNNNNGGKLTVTKYHPREVWFTNIYRVSGASGGNMCNKKFKHGKYMDLLNIAKTNVATLTTYYCDNVGQFNANCVIRTNWDGFFEQGGISYFSGNFKKDDAYTINNTGRLAYRGNITVMNSVTAFKAITTFL